VWAISASGPGFQGVVVAGRGGFNQGSNQGNHTFHGRGRQYEGYTRGWQHPYPRGYRYARARVNGLPGRGGGRHGGQVQAASSQQTITSEVGNQTNFMLLHRQWQLVDRVPNL
jgi:hypothetical protein